METGDDRTRVGGAGLCVNRRQTPVSALVDWIRPKRLAIALAAIVIGIGAIDIVRVNGVAPVVGAQILIGLASVVIPRAIAAISLGLVARPGFARRAVRNEAFNHARNLMATVTCGAAGYFSPGAGSSIWRSCSAARPPWLRSRSMRTISITL
jgi:hypothetical protein